MGSVGMEILWSPVHPDKFITWGTEIYLYEMGPAKEESSTSGHVRTSDTTGATLLATNSTHRYIKCIDICPQEDVDLLLAVGQANGKVVLTSFYSSNNDASGREFVPPHPRQCNTVAWNPIDSNILAVGLEKSRSEPAVLLWDAFRCPHHYNGDPAADHTQKALFELGVCDTANSLAWINSILFAAGLNNKNLKILDRRDPGKSVNNTATKAVYGITVENRNEHVLASYFENQICIWDLRNFEKPISTITRSKPISKISWCPSRPNLLCSLQRESNVLVLHDMQIVTTGTEDSEPTLLERTVQPSTQNLASFSWHKTVESRLLTVSLAGNITDYCIVERITLNWFPSSQIVWTYGKKFMKVISDRDPIYVRFNDISVKIKRRALAHYGLKPELRQNGDLAEDESLKNLWYWLYSSRTLVESGTIKSQANYHPGVLNVLQFDSGKPRSECSNIVWPDLNSLSFVRVYQSEERESAQNLCGWKFEKDPAKLQSFLDKLLMEGVTYSRAAAIAVFNLKLRLAINILTRGAENESTNSNLSIVAMALSGFTGEKSNMWREHCVKSRSSLKDPYLRATFAFLTAENENYEYVLNEYEMAVKDRVAFACIFLSDGKLSEYLVKLTEKLTEDGDLDGILLTGANADGAKLLQNYLDVTGDVQSVSLLAVRAFPVEIQMEQNVQNWFANYRQMLDCKKLWYQRAHFDLALNTANQSEKLAQQIFVSCNFCGKSISSFMQGVSRTRGQYPRVGPSNKTKMSSCPNCRKPLPRCAICLVHMGTPIAGISNDSGNKTGDLMSWFTWCQTCRHGGHAGHISHWFSNHCECPVTGCSCKCLSLDPRTGISNKSESHS